MAETNAEERSLEEARDRVGDTRQEEEERWLKMAAEDQPQISQQRDGGVCWRGRALVGGEVEREVLFLLVVLRGCRPPSRAPVHTHSSSFPCPCRCHRHSQLPCPCQDGLLRVVYVAQCRRSVSYRIEDMGLNLTGGKGGGVRIHGRWTITSQSPSRGDKTGEQSVVVTRG